MPGAGFGGRRPAAPVVPVKGDPGDTGPSGPSGDSAYDLWVANGGEGTPGDFLASLVGPVGPDGVDGAPGADGAPGDTGPAGPPVAMAAPAAASIMAGTPFRPSASKDALVTVLGSLTALAGISAIVSVAISDVEGGTYAPIGGFALAALSVVQVVPGSVLVPVPAGYWVKVTTVLNGIGSAVALSRSTVLLG